MKEGQLKDGELNLLREALCRVKYEAASLADAQVIALEALTQRPAEQAGEQEAFEAWATSVGYHTERDMFKRDKYQSTVTWELWRVWQARASLPTQPAAQATPEPVGEPVARVELMQTGGNTGLATRTVEIDDPLRERLRPGDMLAAAQAKGGV